MRVPFGVIPVLYASLAAAGLISSDPQKPIKDNKPSVPGKNPIVVRDRRRQLLQFKTDKIFQFCGNTTDYILDIHHIDLSPNPPVP